MNFMQLFSQFGYDVSFEVFGFCYRRKALDGLAVFGNEELGEVPEDIALFLYALADTLEHSVCRFGFETFVFLGRGLGLEILEDGIGVCAVDITLGHEREGYTVVEAAELFDLLIATRFLVRELVTGESEDDETLVFVFLVQSLQTVVLRRKTALGSGINDKDHLSFVICEVHLFASVVKDFEIINCCHNRILYQFSCVNLFHVCAAKVQKKSHIRKNIQDFFAFAAILVLVFTFGVHGEPTFANPFALVEYLADTPQGTKSKDAQKDGDIRVFYKQ